jgi:hypothetical protein
MTNTPGANTNNQPTDRSPVYDQLIADRAKWVADFEAIEARHAKNLADIDAAIAAVAARRMPQVGVERRECRNCPGWLVETPHGWVHDRDGQPACQPGHSGPVAQPIDQTTTWPAVSPQGAPHVWGHVKVGQTVRVYWGAGGVEGLVRYVDSDRMVVEDDYSDAEETLAPGDVERVEIVDRPLREVTAPADLDQVTANPAASATLPDEQVRDA